VAWNLPDPVPVHREPIYTRVPNSSEVSDAPRRASVPRGQSRLLRSEGGGGKGLAKQFPIILTSGRLGNTKAARRNQVEPLLAELQQDMFVESTRQMPRARHQGRGWVWSTARKRLEGAVKALVTIASGRAWHSCRSTSPAGSRASISAANIRRGRSIVLGESVNTITSYGYDGYGMHEAR